jgi:predicted metal-dependent phosphoesterase TrpH
VIDLHSHTTASDGELPPEQLLALARAKGVTTLAVTDHDTVDGLERSAAAAGAEGIRFVPGIEVSAYADGREIHVLGHFVNRTEPGLASFSERLRHEREERMGRMVEQMRSLGFPVTFEEVERIAAGAHLGRPHLALALVERGYVTSTREAFDRFLGDRKPGWVDRLRIDAEEAVEMLHKAGGSDHRPPGSSQVGRHTLERLAKAGLDGLRSSIRPRPQPAGGVPAPGGRPGAGSHRGQRLPRAARHPRPAAGNGDAGPVVLLAPGSPGRAPALTPRGCPSLSPPRR